MQATITYLLTEQAQRAQMVATGQPVARKQTTTEDLDAKWLASPLVDIGNDGSIAADLTREYSIDRDGELTRGGYGYFAKVPTQLDFQPFSGIEAMQVITQRIVTAQEQFRAKHDDEAAQKRAKTLDVLRQRKTTSKYTDVYLSASHPRVTYYYQYPDWPSESDPEVLASPEAKQWTAELEAAKETAKAQAIATAQAKQEAEAAKKLAKAFYITSWIAEHADDDTRTQYYDGLLCRNTIIGLIATQAFAQLRIGAKYEPALCSNRDCPCGREGIDCLPRDIYSAWRKIKQQLPNKASVQFEAVRECLRGNEDGCWDVSLEGESAGPPCYAALIKLPVGPFVFERLIQLVQ